MPSSYMGCEEPKTPATKHIKLLEQTSKNNKLNQSAQQRPYQYPRIDPGTFHSSPPQAS